LGTSGKNLRISILNMKNKEVNINVSGKHVHRTPIEMQNPHKASKEDWWDEICKKHGAKNYFPKKKK